VPPPVPPCSLNGEGSPCVCDKGWIGEDCSQLDLLPALPLAQQVTAASATTTSNAVANSTWGMSVVGPDVKTGRYHGYMTEIAHGCLLGDYGTASQVVHLTSTSPLGPWNREGIALKGFAHNPQAVIAPNGSIFLFHIGRELPDGCVKNCSQSNASNSGAARPTCPGTPHGTSVAVADDFDGPWTRYPYILGSRPTNVSAAHQPVFSGSQFQPSRSCDQPANWAVCLFLVTYLTQR
jgi:hypothetical protein